MPQLPFQQSGMKVIYTQRNLEFYPDKNIIMGREKLIKKNNFKIIKIIEKKGLAKFKKENPVVARVILKVMK